MFENSSWRPIGENQESDDVILAVDFTVTGRPEAGFAELAQRLQTPYALWESLPPEVGDEVGMSGDDYLNRWVDDLRSTGAKVKAVFGYCASSAYALALTDRISTWQERPPVVLFDPTAATGETILHYGFFRVVDALSAVLSDEEAQDARAAGTTALSEHDDLETLTNEYVRIYREVGGTVFARVGLDSDRADELIDWFSSFMTYLVAASQVRTEPDFGTVSVIRSGDLPSVLVLGALELGAMDLIAREVCFDVDHASLLTRPEVALAVREILV